MCVFCRRCPELRFYLRGWRPAEGFQGRKLLQLRKTRMVTCLTGLMWILIWPVHCIGEMGLVPFQYVLRVNHLKCQRAIIRE